MILYIFCLFHAGKSKDRNLISGCQGLAVGLTTIGHQKVFEVIECTVSINCGDGYTTEYLGQNSMNFIPKKGEFYCM